MDDDRRRAILAELLAEHPAVPMQQPYQFTVKDYMGMAQVTDAQARRMLDALVRAGVLKSVKGLVTGQPGQATLYWRIEDESDAEAASSRGDTESPEDV